MILMQFYKLHCVGKVHEVWLGFLVVSPHHDTFSLHPHHHTMLHIKANKFFMFVLKSFLNEFYALFNINDVANEIKTTEWRKKYVEQLRLNLAMH